LPPGVVQDVAPTNVPNDVVARKSVTITSCSKTARGWSAGGLAKNAGSATRTYKITIFFVTAGDTVIGHAATKAVVQGGGTADWSAKAAFTPAGTTRCVLRGVA
jgi:hypothetical protein